MSLVVGTVADPAGGVFGLVLVVLHAAPWAVQRRWSEAVLVATVVTGPVYVSLGIARRWCRRPTTTG